MTFTRLLQVLLVPSILLAAGCQPQRETASLRAPVTDELGRTVRMPSVVERAVTLAPNLTEIVFAAGAGGTLVGVTTADDYPPAVESLPRFGALPIDYEAVVALKPDVILATDHVNALSDAAQFEALGLPIYFFSYNDLDGMLESIRVAGRLLGTAAHADATADSLAAAIDSLRRRTETVAHRPLTLFLISDETLFSFGDESYIHTMISLAGGQSATAAIGTNAPVLSDEYVLSIKPEVIIGAFGDDYDPARLLELHPTWDIVPAIEQGRVYGLDPDLFLRPGPRLVEGAWRMAATLHPSLVRDP